MRIIEDKEHVWHDVYRARNKKALKGRKINTEIKSMFGNKEPKQKLSTNLYDSVCLVYATKEGDRRSKNVNGANRVEGWWVMPVGEIRSSSLLVEHSPTSSNPHHADIILPDEAVSTWEDAEPYIIDLLTMGEWKCRA